GPPASSRGAWCVAVASVAPLWGCSIGGGASVNSVASEPGLSYEACTPASTVASVSPVPPIADVTGVARPNVAPQTGALTPSPARTRLSDEEVQTLNDRRNTQEAARNAAPR